MYHNKKEGFAMDKEEKAEKEEKAYKAEKQLLKDFVDSMQPVEKQ